MHFKLLTAIFLGLISSSSALADSFCGFDRGLVGTKAIGFVSPFELSTSKYEAGACELIAFDRASEEAFSKTLKCTDFQHLPSVYIDNYEDEGFDPIASDYFHLQVLDAKDKWAQLLLKSGGTKWVKKKGTDDFNFPYQFKTNETSISMDKTYPTQGSVYSKPNLTKPDPFHGTYLRALSDGWIDSQVSPEFFNSEIFKVLEKHSLFNPNHIEQAKLATHYKEFLHISYDVTAIIRDDDGREWLKAQEVLELSFHDFFGYIHEELKARDRTLTEEEDSRLYDLFWETYRSKPGRVVYLPYRDPSGTITMAMIDGPNCGC